MRARTERQTLKEMAANARAAGMTYGQFVAMNHNPGKRTEAVAQKADRTCARCGSEIIGRWERSRYCSDYCYKRHYVAIKKGRAEPPPPLPPRHCPHCGAEVEASSQRTYCSKECGRAAEQERRRKRRQAERAASLW